MINKQKPSFQQNEELIMGPVQNSMNYKFVLLRFWKLMLYWTDAVGLNTKQLISFFISQ